MFCPQSRNKHLTKSMRCLKLSKLDSLNRRTRLSPRIGAISVRETVKVVSFVVALLILFGPAPPAKAPLPAESLKSGFLRLYDLDFAGAQREFEACEKLHPADPMGTAGEAADILFSEFNRLGVLEAQFYESDSVFAARKKYDADPAQRTRFVQQLDRAEQMAKAKLNRDPRDLDSLFAMTLSNGLHSDFAALIEKRNIASLHYTKQATTW